jgi:hypothetical protein
MKHYTIAWMIAVSIPDCLIRIFSLKYSFRPHYVSEVDTASNRNEYQEFSGGKGGRCVGLTTLLLSCADCLEIWDPQPPGILTVCPGL